MSKRKKTIIWLFRCLLVFGILTIAALVLAPRLINLETVRSNIEDKISHQLGGEIKYRRLQLSYFPSPHVAIHKAEIFIPKSLRIKIHRMKIYPKLVPLLKGSLQIAFIRLEYADYFMKLPQINNAKPKPEEITPIDDIMKSIARGLQNLPKFKLPDLNLKIKYGKVNLVDPFGRTFKLRQMQGDYHRSSTKLDFSIKCQSNLWDQVDINGSLNPSDLKGRGHIQLSRFRPQDLLAYLFPDSAMQVTDTRATVAIAFESDGKGNIEADVDGSIPSLQLSQGKEKLVIKGSRIKGKVQVGGNMAKATITQMGLNYPKMNVTGMFSYDEKLRAIRLEINGSEIDAASVRHTALTLAGKSQTIRDVFDIIRGGHVPWMSVRIRGRTIAELGVLDNIVIRGRMTEGKIFIPGIELDLEDVVGDAVISEGILHGEKLQARTGNSRGLKGTMALGLNADIVPLKLQIGVNADLSELPPVLGRIIEDKEVLNELDLIQDVKGNANGTLTLDHEPAGLKAKVEVSKVHLTARYMRLPYPIEADGGHFVYTGTHIVFDNFNANIGKSSLSQFSTSIDWAGTPRIAAASKAADFNLAEFHSWLTSFDAFKKYLIYFNPLKGSIPIQNLNIEGPFFRPQDWRIQTRGSLSGIVMNIKNLPESLQLVSGGFSWQESQITFNDVGAVMGGSSISQLTAIFDLEQSSSIAVHAKSAELFAAEIFSWLSSFEKTKGAFKDLSATGGILTLDNLNIEGPFQQPDKWHYRVTCKMQDLALNSDALGKPVTVNNGVFGLTGEPAMGESRSRLDLKTTDLTWGASQLTLVGEMEFAKNDILLDMAISADGIEWIQVEKVLDQIRKSKTDSDRPAGKGNLLGTLRVQTDRFSYESYSVQPLHLEISFETDKAIITVNRADVCGISFQGLLKVSEQTMDIYMVPAAVDQDLASAITCITDEKSLATGTYNISGELLSKSKPVEFMRSFSGNVKFSAEEGRIYRFGLLAKILAILNVTEIYRGEVPDLTGEGFAYHSMSASAEIKDGMLIMKECNIDGVSMGIACEGKIDLADKKMDLVILVAPFKTVDRIVKFIPLVGHILGGKLISIPFRAKGDLRDPSVIPLPPTAVGTKVLGILERTLKLPITIIQPVFSDKKNKKEDRKE
jgi:hypothetical protein